MSGDSILPTIAPPSPPSADGGEPQDDRYGSGGYFSGDSRREGKGGINTEPLPYFKILRKQGNYYWYINFRYNSHWGEYSVCIYHSQTNADWTTLTEEQKQSVYEKAELVWEIANDTSREKNYSEHLKLIEDNYQNGYYFARAKKKDRLGRPTVCQPFPAEGKFVIPDKIKNFQIEESPYYANNYTNPISCIAISYSPPDHMAGFWGVKVYIQGYQGDDEIRELAIRKYDKRQGEDDVFNIFLEPSQEVFIENHIIGDDYTSGGDYNDIMYPVKRAFSVDRVQASATDTDTIVAELYACTGTPLQWVATDPSSIYYLDKKAHIGDTITFTAMGSGANAYSIEAIIKKFDDTNPHRKIYCTLRNNPSSTKPDDYDIGSVFPYLYWQIVKSCKFYLVAINEYGYHGDLESEALVEYCALDALESAPLPPHNVMAMQCENQNVITFSFSSYLTSFDDMDCFHIYRYIISEYDNQWVKIGTIKAKSSNETGNSDMGTSEPYKYIDGDMANLEWDEQMWNYSVGVMYGVSSQDKAGRQSIIKVATHYLIDGTIAEYLPFRRGTGVDHSPITVVRNNAYNLFYNSEANWDYYYGSTYGYGNPHYNDWAVWDEVYAHPAYSLYWDNTNSYFYLYTNNSTVATRFKNLFKLIVQRLSIIPVSGVTYNPTSSGDTYKGLGRAKIIIPGSQYSCRISQIRFVETVAPSYSYYLYLYPESNEKPPFTANRTLLNSEYFISIVPFFGDIAGTITDIMQIDTGYPFFRNGWLYYHSGGTNPTWTNGYLYLLTPSSGSAGRCAYGQFVRKDNFYAGEAVTCSFYIARQKGNWSGASYGILGFSIVLNENPIYQSLPMYSPGVPYYEDGAYINLSEIPNTASGNPYNFEYVVLYSTIPSLTNNNNNWSFGNRLDFWIVAQWENSDVHSSYIITKPMLNFGNEASPYNPRNYPERLAFRSPVLPNENPQNPKEDDPMCVEENQEILLANGKWIKAKDVQERMVLKGNLYNNIVEKISYAERQCIEFEFENGKNMIVSSTHNCYVGFVYDCLAIRKAMDVITGFRMWDEVEQKMVEVISKRNVGKKKVVKISTAYPHHIVVNGILTHNIKAGGGEY